MDFKTTSSILFKEEPLVINRGLAKLIGLNEAIVLQQVHYWLDVNRKANINFHDGRTWTFSTYESWNERDFDIWSLSTLKRVFKSLFDKGLLIKGNYNLHKYDRTLWISIDYDKLDNIFLQTKVQNDTMLQSAKVSKWNEVKSQNDTKKNIKMNPTIQETNKETNKEINITTQQQVACSENKELIEGQTHLVLDSANKIKKVNTWNKDRLLKAIEIFKEQDGQYFSLLEKIYKDDKNFMSEQNKSTSKQLQETPRVFVPNYTNGRNNQRVNETFRNYQAEELEALLLAAQRDKF